MAVLKPIQIIIDSSSGSILGGNNGNPARLDNYTNVVQLVSEYDSGATIFANYLRADSNQGSDMMFLAKDGNGDQLYGRDVVDQDDPNYQDYTNWLVWEAEISKDNLQKISKFRAGSIKINFTLWETRDVTQVENGNNLGTFGDTTGGTTTIGDLDPNYTGSENDYYRCGVYNYYYATEDVTYNYNEAAYWDGDSWEKGTTKTYVGNTDSQSVSVEGGLTTFNFTLETDEAKDITEKLHELDGRTTDNKNEIDTKMPLDIQTLGPVQSPGDASVFAITVDGTTYRITLSELRELVSEAIDDVVADYPALLTKYPELPDGDTSYDDLNIVVIDASGAPNVEDQVDNSVWRYDTDATTGNKWRNTGRLAQVTVEDFNNLVDRVEDIEDGTTVVGRANADKDNNEFSVTYEKIANAKNLSLNSVEELNDVSSSGSGEIITSAERTQITTNQTNISTNATDISNVDTDLQDHKNNQNNPHQTTATQLGAESTSNKVNNFDTIDNVTYPTTNAVSVELDQKADTKATIASTGIIELDGVLCTKNQSDNTAIDITAGEVRFVDNTNTTNPDDIILDFAGGTYNIPNITNDWITWVYLYNDNGTVRVSSQTTQPADLADFVYIAEVFHAGGTVLSVNQVGFSAGANAAINLADYIPESYINRVGNVYSYYNLLEMQRSSGFSVGPGVNRDLSVSYPNRLFTALDAPAQFTLIYRDGSGGVTFDNNNDNYYSSWGDTLFGGTNPISDYYDDGSGTLALKTAGTPVDNSASNNRILLTPQIDDVPRTFVLMGQNDYATMDEAKTAIDNNDEAYNDIDSRVFGNSIDRSYLSIKRAATDLSDDTQGRFKEITSGGGTSASQGGTTTNLDDTAINNTSAYPRLQAYGTNQKDVNEGISDDLDTLDSQVATLETEVGEAMNVDETFNDTVQHPINAVKHANQQYVRCEGNTVTQYADNTDNHSNWVIDTDAQITINDGLSYVEITSDGATASNTYVETNLKDNTEYTVLVNCLYNDLSVSGTVVDGGNYNTSSVFISAGITGILKQTFTTGTIVANRIRQYASTSEILGNKFELRSTILEGDHTSLTDTQALNIIESCEYGYCSVKDMQYDATGKNMFDEVLEVNSRSLTTGEIIASTTNITNSNLIPILPSTDYNLKNFDNLGIRYYEYDINQNFIQSIFVSSNFTFTSSSNAYYLAFISTSTDILSKYQLEKGTESTDYYPYTLDTVKQNLIFSGEELRSINDIHDETVPDRDGQNTMGYDYNDVLKNSTGWNSQWTLTNTKAYTMSLYDELEYKIVSNNDTIPIISVRIGNDYFNNVTANDQTTTDIENLFSMNSSGTLAFRVNKTTYPDSASFETYLQSNDVEFFYELETPTNTTYTSLDKIERIDRDYNNVVKYSTGWLTAFSLTNTHIFYMDLSSELGYAIPSTTTTIANVKLKIGDTFFIIDDAASNVANDIENVLSINTIGNYQVRVNKTTYPDSATFEAYLQANDVEFLYELDTSNYIQDIGQLEGNNDDLIFNENSIIEITPETILGDTIFNCSYNNQGAHKNMTNLIEDNSSRLQDHDIILDDHETQLDEHDEAIFRLQQQIDSASGAVNRYIRMLTPYPATTTETKVDFDVTEKETNDTNIIDFDGNNDHVLKSTSTVGYNIWGNFKVTNKTSGNKDASILFRLYSDGIEKDNLTINLVGNQTATKTKLYPFALDTAPQTLTVTSEVIEGDVKIVEGNLYASISSGDSFIKDDGSVTMKADLKFGNINEGLINLNNNNIIRNSSGEGGNSTIMGNQLGQTYVDTTNAGLAIRKPSGDTIAQTTENLSDNIITDTGSTTKYTSVNAVETYASKKGVELFNGTTSITDSTSSASATTIVSSVDLSQYDYLEITLTAFLAPDIKTMRIDISTMGSTETRDNAIDTMYSNENGAFIRGVNLYLENIVANDWDIKGYYGRSWNLLTTGNTYTSVSNNNITRIVGIKL